MEKRLRIAVLLVLGAAAVSACGTVAEQPKAAPGSNKTLDLLTEIQGLRTELQQLRNQVEINQRGLEAQQSRQRELYDDLDVRLRAQERKAATRQPAGAPPPPATSLDAAAAELADPAVIQDEYDKAFELLRGSQYAAAIKAFRTFLVNHPRSPLAANAHYWVAESHYVTQDFAQARKEFESFVVSYPQSEKVPDAMLKIGYSHFELGDAEKGRSVLSSIITKYPDSRVAKSAESRLQKAAR